MILIWDTGASYGLIPFRSDFIDHMECNIPVKDVTKVNRVIVTGTTLHKFIESNGQDILLPCISYHLTQTYVRLFITTDLPSNEWWSLYSARESSNHALAISKDPHPC